LKVTIPSQDVPKMYHAEIAQTNLHLFYVQRKIGD